MTNHPSQRRAHVRGLAALSLGFVAISLLGCPLGRGNNELGAECRHGTDCANVHCASNCGPNNPDCPKSFCTKTCAADSDCVSKVGAMVCTNGECAFPEK